MEQDYTTSRKGQEDRHEKKREREREREKEKEKQSKEKMKERKKEQINSEMPITKNPTDTSHLFGR